MRRVCCVCVIHSAKLVLNWCVQVGLLDSQGPACLSSISQAIANWRTNRWMQSSHFPHLHIHMETFNNFQSPFRTIKFPFHYPRSATPLTTGDNLIVYSSYLYLRIMWISYHSCWPTEEWKLKLFTCGQIY